VIPKWIAAHLGLAGEAMTHERAVGITLMGGVPFGDFASRIYCDGHHKQINRLIENRQSRELLKGLFSGGATILDSVEQRRVAAWAVKTCYAQWGMVRRRWGIPIGHRRHLLQTGEPHPSVFVSISHSTGEKIRVIFARTEMTTPGGEVTHYYDFVMAVGQLVLKVWGPSSRLTQATYKTPTSFTTRIWPVADQIARWPPGRLLDDDGVTELWDYDPRSLKGQKGPR
jgi:hypothetical protein